MTQKTEVRRPLAPLLLVPLACALACTGGGGAAPSSVPARSCTVTVWYKPASDAAHVEVIGSWDGWARPGRVLDASRSDGWRVSAWELTPGAYSYGIDEDGVWVADPSVPTTTFHGDTEVAWVSVPDCDVPAVRVDGVTASPGGDATIDATFLSARAADAVDPSSVTVATLAGAPLAPRVTAAPRTGKLGLALSGVPAGKTTVVVRAKDARGKDAEPARASLWVEPSAFDPRDTTIYQVMVDRYRDASGAPLAAPALAAGRAGGHVDGVRKAVESGEIQSMGFNTIWLSPLYANPEGTFPGADGRPYTSYHGYWPTAARDLEPAQADEAAVDALVAAAHARGVRILFDVVPHHVHQQHPYFVQHENDGWFRDVGGQCVCGAPMCDWGTHIEDCWFASYLPSFDWRDQSVADQVSADVEWWLDRFDADGIRIDAVPMMPRAAIRRIVHEIRSRLDHPLHSEFLLGENFTGPGGWDLIRYDLGPFGLDSEFDFPTLWVLRGALGTFTSTMADVDAIIQTGQAAWNGSGAIMGMTIGNHDVARFASVAAGDGDGDGWTPAVQPVDPSVYARQQMALAVVFTLPGAPVVYYGDEVALAGHADPDSRRVLPDDATLTAAQSATKSYTTLLGKARACEVSLRRGTFRSLGSDAEHLVYARELDGAETAFVVLQRNVAAAYSTPLPGVPAGDYVDVLSGAKVTVDPAATVLDSRPLTAALYVPAGSPCAAAR